MGRGDSRVLKRHAAKVDGHLANDCQLLSRPGSLDRRWLEGCHSGCLPRRKKQSQARTNRRMETSDSMRARHLRKRRRAGIRKFNDGEHAAQASKVVRASERASPSHRASTRYQCSGILVAGLLSSLLRNDWGAKGEESPGFYVCPNGLFSGFLFQLGNICAMKSVKLCGLGSYYTLHEVTQLGITFLFGVFGSSIGPTKCESFGVESP